MKELLRVEGITKSFGKIVALSNVSTSIYNNEIVGLVGDNGAGKSTLIKIISGVYGPNKGKIYYKGKLVQLKSVQDAMRLGIETIYQDHSVVPSLTVSQNIYLAREIYRKIPLFRGISIKFKDTKKMNEESKLLLEMIGINISPTSMVEDLSGGERQSVAFSRTRIGRIELLLLDEPTASLSIGESERVINYIIESKKEISSVFVTHNPYLMFPVCDRFVVLSKGRKIADVKKENITQQELIKLITKGKTDNTEHQ